MAASTSNPCAATTLWSTWPTASRSHATNDSPIRSTWRRRGLCCNKHARSGIGQLVLTSSANALGVAACGTGQPCTEASYPAGDQDTGHYYFQHKALLEHLANWYWVNAADGKTKLAVVRPCYVVGEHFDNSGLRTLLAKFVVYPQPSRSYYQFLWDTDLVRRTPPSSRTG